MIIFSVMDDIANLAYVLIFVVWFLYKTFVKGKKQSRPLPPFDQRAPEPTQQRSRESTSPPISFEDVLRELTGAPPVTAKEPEIIEETLEPYPIEDIHSSMEEPSFEVFGTPDETQPAVSRQVLNADFSAYKVRKERSSKAARGALRMLKTKQGAKQAFIMKEIFDRKY